MSCGDDLCCLQVKDLEQRLTKVTDAKASVEEKLKASEHFVQSLEAELQTTKATLEARQAELKESQDRVCDMTPQIPFSPSLHSHLYWSTLEGE